MQEQEIRMERKTAVKYLNGAPKSWQRTDMDIFIYADIIMINLINHLVKCVHLHIDPLQLDSFMCF